MSLMSSSVSSKTSEGTLTDETKLPVPPPEQWPTDGEEGHHLSDRLFAQEPATTIG